jgi:hypothetical protein
LPLLFRDLGDAVEREVYTGEKSRFAVNFINFGTAPWLRREPYIPSGNPGDSLHAT